MKLLLLFAHLILLISGCNTTEPGGTENRIILSLEDVSCTEAWLSIKSENLNTINLYRDDSLIAQFNKASVDTVYFDDFLLPNRTYLYKVTTTVNNKIISSETAALTMDTTSHNFSWQNWTFGDVGSSDFYDVAIINENNIWVVGEIYMNDSLGNSDHNPYNAVHWDGVKWELKRILFPSVCGSTITVAYPAKTIFMFEDEIWITSSGDKIAILKNELQVSQFCLPENVSMSIHKLWGRSSNDLYAVGNKGKIAYYNGEKWTKIESGTTSNINDIWGIYNPRTKEEDIYAAASFVFQPGDKKILTIRANKVDSLEWNLDRRLHSIWSKNGLFLYTAGGGIFENKKSYWNEITEVPLYYTRNIRGTDHNNIFVCGDLGIFAHFNGLTWKTFNEFSLQGVYHSVAAKNNIIVMVGFKGTKAIIWKGTRM